MTAPPHARQDDPRLAPRIEAVRAFNRFYTRKIGVLRDGLLGSSFSLTEARVLFELARHEEAFATGLARELELDPGYLSRILRKLVREGLVARVAAAKDRRQSRLWLTDAGRAAFDALDRASRDEMGALVATLSPGDQERLVAAMSAVRRLLDDAPAQPAGLALRPHRPGDMGWVVSRHGELYAREYGFDGRFEALVARIAADFIDRFDPERERCWIAERDGERVGSAFLVHDSDQVARLRLLLVERHARGHGVGARLIEECLGFSRRAGYRAVTLWTNDVLTAARRLYERAGFRLVKQEPHASFGCELIGQTWKLGL